MVIQTVWQSVFMGFFEFQNFGTLITQLRVQSRHFLNKKVQRLTRYICPHGDIFLQNLGYQLISDLRRHFTSWRSERNGHKGSAVKRVEGQLNLNSGTHIVHNYIRRYVGDVFVDPKTPGEVQQIGPRQNALLGHFQYFYNARLNCR
ncbi:hypothetical protein [Ruegeria halocynthiae]|uniref:hypothetical protein n=1 Tax=Ruegeria halocynthiae TaxID=985054 RepID=UPI001FE0D6AB|nr:hypothetical protein [Ruegeria halocynthiae]